METLSDKIESKIEETLMKAESIFKTKFSFPAVDYSLRGACAGQYVRKNETNEEVLRFNIELAKNNEEEFVTQTVPHEVAHLISRNMYGFPNGHGHGMRWKMTMMALGVEPTRCHSYDISVTTNRKRVEYTCNCGQTFHLTAHRIRKIHLYHCKKCKSKLFPKTA